MWAVLFNTIFLNFSQAWISLNFINIFLCPLLIIPSAPTVTGMVFVFIFHILVISISGSFYLLSFSNSLAEILLYDGTFMSINWHVLFRLCLITASGLLACIVPSVLIEKSHRMVTFGVSITDKDLCSYHLLGVSIS